MIDIKNIFGTVLYTTDTAESIKGAIVAAVEGCISLRFADLHGAIDLCGADLRGADLNQANLYGVDLHGADLRKADLRGAYLSCAGLSSVRLLGAHLSDANLSYSNLNKTDLEAVDLQGVNLAGAYLHGANLAGAYLDGANLKKSTLPSPTVVLLASWGEVSDELCADLMLYNASCHPDSKAFDVWAEGGIYPYEIEVIGVDRAANFKERKELWGKGKACSPYDLMMRLFAEKGIKR